MEIGHVDHIRRLDVALASALATADPELIQILTAAADIPYPASQDWFPGRDYPDREVWLAKRNTPRGQIHGKLIYTHTKSPKMEPLALGINRAKREAHRVDVLTRRADVNLFSGSPLSQTLRNVLAKRPLQHAKIMKARADYRAARYEVNRNG